jgi:hypothetical protein
MYAYSNSVVPICFKLGYVCNSNAVGLNTIDIHDEVLMKVNCPKTSSRWIEMKQTSSPYSSPTSEPGILAMVMESERWKSETWMGVTVLGLLQNE